MVFENKILYHLSVSDFIENTWTLYFHIKYLNVHVVLYIKLIAIYMLTAHQ